MLSDSLALLLIICLDLPLVSRVAPLHPSAFPFGRPSVVYIVWITGPDALLAGPEAWLTGPDA